MPREDNRREESIDESRRFKNRPEVQQTKDAEQSDGKGVRSNVDSRRDPA